VRVRFEWLTGLRQPIFRNLRLRGSWGPDGRYSDTWAMLPMKPFAAEDGCPAWYADVDFDDAQLGWTFHWGAVADGPQIANVWAIPTEVPDLGSTTQDRSFVLTATGTLQRYYLTHCRRFGANKVFKAGNPSPSIRFSLWAPNAKKIEVVIGEAQSGYIAIDGTGIAKDGTGAERSIAMQPVGEGFWHSTPVPALDDFAAWDHKPYMYRIERDDGSVRYRTDLYSRCQIGSGRKDPKHSAPGEPPWDGTRQDLKGTKGCSVIIDPERVTELLNEGVFPETKWLTENQFWANEYDPLRPVPSRLEDLVIYEMHVDGLAAGSNRPGTFADAIQLLDHLAELGVNAVELLPAAEAESWSWGYGTSHYFATEYAGGGRDQLKHFVRACHQHGIAVLMDVVYNHYVGDAERSEWLYDTATHSRNGYYWYQGQDSDWPFPEGGYLDNGSSGFTPNFRSEIVREMFVSSAVALVTEFHIDGFRMDLTQAMHRDNVVHANGNSCPEANQAGIKFLREWVRTLRLIRPSVILTAEDHTGWRSITQPQTVGGIGFDAAWWADWYHNLIGDSQNNQDNVRLLYVAGQGGDGPLSISRLGSVVEGTPLRLIYNESHDQAGNASYKVGSDTYWSARTIQVAVNGHLDGNRAWAEARCRAAAALTLLTPGVPMFFMGEEVGAKEPYRYNDWIQHREDFAHLKQSEGARLFAFYRDLIRTRLRNDAILSPNVAIVHVHDSNRVIAFRRWLAGNDVLVVANLNNAAFANGYWLAHQAILDGDWIEILNSDADIYGGTNLCNPGTHRSDSGRVNLRLAANAVSVLQRT
jgi:1,4-alpha-glucan branching enzyme